MTLLAIVLIWCIGGSLLLGLYYRRALFSTWREPVCAQPILVIESDDWGPGPPEHARALERLAALLADHGDSHGRPAVMTLGVVLAVPDGARIRESAFERYARRTLADEAFHPIVEAMRAGERSGVFALQLHGMEHCWPRAVLAAARVDAAVADKLSVPLCDPTELPAHLQSRWTDASTLPSTPLPRDEAMRAAEEEVRAYERLFGTSPAIVVPPTFVWNRDVERAWVSAGVHTVVTPGAMLEMRGADGRPVAIGPPLYNGTRSPSGATYVVRNAYFEPKFGHTAQTALAAFESNLRKGRPTLFETHRFNFTDPEVAETAFTELAALLREAGARYGDIRFMSTRELLDELMGTRARLAEKSFPRRLRAWLQRLREVPRLRKLAFFTGLGILAWLALAATGSGSREETRALGVGAARP